MQEETDKNFSYLCIYHVADKKFVRLADEDVRSVSPAPKEKFAIGTDIREYELMSNLDGRSYQDVYVINLKTGERKLALKKARWMNAGRPPTARSSSTTRTATTSSTTWPPGRPRTSRRRCPTSFIDTEDDHNVVKPPQPSLGWTKDGDAVLLSDGWDIWKVPAPGGTGTNLTVNGKKDGIRYRSVLRLDTEEKGWDLSVARYIAMFGEYTKKGGVGRLDPGKPGITPLLWDDATFARAEGEEGRRLRLHEVDAVGARPTTT